MSSVFQDFVSGSEFGNSLNSLVQSTMADFVSQMSTYVQALCSEIVGQAGAFRFKALVCLQAQTLELQQMRVQLSNVLTESSSLVHHNHLLQDRCSDQVKIITSLKEEMSTMEAELASLRKRDEESQGIIMQLQLDIDESVVLLQAQSQQLKTLRKEKCDLELEVAHLKQTIHMQPSMGQEDQVPCFSGASDVVDDGGKLQSCVTSDGLLSVQDGPSFPLPIMSSTASAWILPSPTLDV